MKNFQTANCDILASIISSCLKLMTAEVFPSPDPAEPSGFANSGRAANGPFRLGMSESRRVPFSSYAARWYDMLYVLLQKMGSI